MRYLLLSLTCALSLFLVACVAPGTLRHYSESSGTRAAVGVSGAILEAAVPVPLQVDAAYSEFNDRLAALESENGDEPMDFGDWFDVIGPAALALVFGRETQRTYRERKAAKGS